jgi:FKBP-type peptidyl-prolyl cis-trans isomerase
VELDPRLYIQGFQEALAGRKTLLTETEARAALMELQNGMRRKRSDLQAEKLKELAEKNKKEGEEFLAGNRIKDGVVTLESGLQYRILKAGDGPKPTTDDTVVCHYRGTLIDGTEFDSSYQRNQTATFPLKNVVKGWTEALQLMPAGSKWQIFIPPHLAYGERGAPAGKIGPSATLIFEVELISIESKS